MRIMKTLIAMAAAAMLSLVSCQEKEPASVVGNVSVSVGDKAVT